MTRALVELAYLGAVLLALVLFAGLADVIDPIHAPDEALEEVTTPRSLAAAASSEVHQSRNGGDD